MIINKCMYNKKIVIMFTELTSFLHKVKRVATKTIMHLDNYINKINKNNNKQKNK